MTVGSDTLRFSYDAKGSPMTVTWNGEVYTYVTNLQGDVMYILDSTGNPAVSYDYSAYGCVVNTSGAMALMLGAINPLRYRGYVYDAETGLYYLQSRYYNPELGRFISPDAVYDTDAGIQGYNIFLYCANNPVNRIDISGADSEPVADLDLTNDVIEDKENGKSGSNRTIPTDNNFTNNTGQASSTKPKGMNNNNTKTAAQRGQEKHREASYGPGVEKEKTIAPGNRVDAIDRSNHTIYELKPNNPRAIIRGQGQLVRYLTAASGKYGGTWFGILITYD